MSALLGALQIRAITAVVLLAALFWPRVDSKAAFWSMLVGSSIALIWNFASRPFDIAPLWPALAVAAVILVTLTVSSKKKISEEYLRYQKVREEMIPILASENNKQDFERSYND